MTIQEVKDRLTAVFRALDAVEVAGYRNVCNVAAAMNILQEITQADIQADAEQSEQGE